MAVFLYIALTLAAVILLVPIWADMLRAAGHMKSNYCAKSIPQSMGSILLPIFLLSAALALWSGIIPPVILRRAAIVVFGMGLLGLLDDIWGDEKSRGFKGHFLRLFRHGEISTGLAKAVAGYIIALWAVNGLPGFFLLLFWRAALVALSANLLNLLDLRPGRSLKAFFIVSLILVWRAPAENGILLLFPFWLASLVHFPIDLKARGMLGDTGANVLGGIVGLAVVLTAPAFFQVIYMALLIGVHVLAEKISLTKLIAENALLRFLDTAGRDGWEK